MQESLTKPKSGILPVNFRFVKCLLRLHDVDLSGNSISFLTKQFCQSLPHVRDLNLENNNIKTLKKETFFPFRKLLKLNLNGNRK